MEIISNWDILAIKAIATTAVAYHARRFLKSRSKLRVEPLIPISTQAATDQKQISILEPTRSIKKALVTANKRCMVFHGSETGTAERLADAFSRTAKAEYDLDCLVASLSSYDFDDLVDIDPQYFVVFLLSTAGEGEVTTSAIKFAEFLQSKNDRSTLGALRYACFGLGSRSYRNFNGAAKQIDQLLESCGAHRLGSLGLGDDSAGSMEDDYLTWQTTNMPIIAHHLGLSKRPYEITPKYQVQELEDSNGIPVLDGEPPGPQLYGRIKGPFTSQNPYPAPISNSRLLVPATSGRNVMHIEFDTAGTTVSYVTGDHLAVMPTNAEEEVDRFLEVFGLKDRQNVIISTTSKDPSAPAIVEGLTTYRAALRCYLNICGPVSRQTLSLLATFAKDETSRDTISELSKNSEKFKAEVTSRHFSLARLLQTRTQQGAWVDVDFGLLMECVGSLKPRYYSISSSNQVSKDKISITVVHDRKIEHDWPFTFEGVSTSYLSELCSGPRSSRRVLGPKGCFLQPTAYTFVRRSNFRMPRRAETPIIMIGPGTGVAPFRAFVQERALQSRQGRDVGETVLFYGCRREDEDFLYKDEWEALSKSFKPGTFTMHTAFSRAPGQAKRYVQDDVEDQSSIVLRLLLDQNTHVYVCGNAGRMAKDVYSTMARILDQSSRLETSATEYLQQMIKDKRWQEDVW